MTRSKKVILIIDDDEMLVDALGLYLGNLGYEIHTALTGESGAGMIREKLPDLVVLDVMLPGMDGHDICREMKEDPATGNIPVLFLSARTSSTDIDEGHKARADDYLTKPFLPAKLHGKIMKLLNES